MNAVILEIKTHKVFIKKKDPPIKQLYSIRISTYMCAILKGIGSADIFY